jgi:uncharacterized membrane protein YccC
MTELELAVTINGALRIVMMSVVLYFAVRHRHRIAILIVLSYSASLVASIFLELPRPISLFFGTVAAGLISWFIIWELENNKKEVE